MPKWTDEQIQAIKLIGNNIIVSAGAGSGKTAVLTERVCEHIRNGYHVNELLILTFTKAAAQEMKDRIRNALKKENRIEELNLLNSSYITTFDSFALGLVKRYHYVLNISRNIEITPESIVSISTIKIIDEIFNDRFLLNDKDFLKLVDKFALKDVNDLKNIVYNLNTKFDQYVYKDNELNTYMEEHFKKEYTNWLIDYYYQIISKQIDDLSYYVNQLLNETSGNISKTINEWYELIVASSLENKINKLKISLPRKNKECTEDYSKVKKQLNDEINKIISLYESHSREQMEEELEYEKEIVSVFISLLKELNQRINKYKNENEIYNFYDIARLAILIVKNNPNIRVELTNEFKEIMIDEYQDTSDIQEELINLITKNNCYMVGDVKQSIYGFRNANPELFKSKYSSFTDYKEITPNNIEIVPGIKIDLLENFRSRNEVIEVINDIFVNAMNTDYGGVDFQAGHKMIQGNLVYDESPKDNDFTVEVLNYINFEKNEDKAVREAFIIAQDILTKKEHMQIYDKELKSYRHVEYKDFVILCDREKNFNLFKKVFEYFDIPLKVYHDESLNNGYNLLIINNIIKFIINTLDYPNVNKQKFNYLFASIARSYVYSSQYTDDMIFNYITSNTISETSIFKLSQSIANKLSIYTNTEIIELILQEFKFYEKINTVGDLDNFEAEISYLLTLAKNLKNIKDYSEFLSSVIENQLELKYSSVVGKSDSVRLMNIHKSKGLEFPICYYIGLSSSFNDQEIKESFVYDKNIGIITPYIKDGEKQTFLKEIYKYNYLNNSISEHIRLFYVALTRAKEKIIFLDEIEEVNKINVITNTIRSKYNKFKKIMDSVYSKLKTKIIDVSTLNMQLTKEYLYQKKIKPEIILQNSKYGDVEKVITLKQRSFDFNTISLEENKYSKICHKLDDANTKKQKQLGTKIHEFLEMIDFNDLNTYNYEEDNSYMKVIIDKMKQQTIFNRNYLHIYKEYEFIDENNVEGIIDLLLEDDNCYYIVDYKLKNIDDLAYATQLNGYKEYIKKKTNKEVKIYLYSLFDGILQEMN